MITKIIVPLDGSKLAEGVLPNVRELAHCLGCRVVLLQVLTHKSYDYLISDPGMSASLRETEEAQACDYLGPLLSALKAEGIERVVKIASQRAGRDYKELLGVPELFGEMGFSPLVQRSARPTLEINGLTSGYQGPGSKTVLPARASAKVDFRLIPDQDPADILKKLRAYLDAQGFH